MTQVGRGPAPDAAGVLPHPGAAACRRSDARWPGSRPGPESSAPFRNSKGNRCLTDIGRAGLPWAVESRRAFLLPRSSLRIRP